jgi:hypothetical protein
MKREILCHGGGDLAVALLAWAMTASTPARADQQPPQGEAGACVAAALRAEVAGDNAGRNELLAKARSADPALPAAHWHGAEVQFDGAWRTLEEIQGLVKDDSRRSEYRALRDSLSDDPEDQRTLARWCAKQGLASEARFHWAKLAWAAPGDEEARDRLDLQEYRGRLFTSDQVAELERTAKEYKRNLQSFQPAFMQLVRDAASGEPGRREAALAAIRKVSDPAALPALEYVVTVKSTAKTGPLSRLPRAAREQLSIDLHVAMLAALVRLPQHAATVDLVNYAVFSPWPEVRQAAAEGLKPRTLTDYVPLLMSGLRAPIEADIDVVATPDGTVRLTETLSTKGPNGAAAHTRETSYETIGAINYDPRRSNPSAVLARHLDRAEAIADQTQANTDEANATAAEMNERIATALRIATGREDMSVDPEKWWSTWADYNELYVQQAEGARETRSYQDFVYYYPQLPAPSYFNDDRSASGFAPKREPVARRGRNRYEISRTSRGGGTSTIVVYRSCFAAGTPVWTQGGPAAIETLQAGDMVLSQDPDSGELAFQPLLELTVRPARHLMKIGVGNETIVATRGHRFWVDGQGWEMAKFLKPRMRLHAVDRGAEISEVTPQRESYEQEAFNLVVDGFHTYFVGAGRLLVCDNSCPAPTLAVTPGLIEAKSTPASTLTDQMASMPASH